MIIRKLFPFLTLLLCLVAGFGCGRICDAVQTLPPGLVIGDSEGIYASSEGEYGIDLDNLLPGDTHEKEITIRSLDLEEPFSLGLLVEPIASEGPLALEEHIEMTLTLDDEEIYQGPLLGDGSFDWTKTPLELGVCKYGTDKLLRATFVIDKTLSSEQFSESSELTFYWTFVGTKDQKPLPSSEPPADPPEEPKQPAPAASPPERVVKRLPQTGEQLVYMFMSGLLLVLIALFLWKKRREEEQE